MVPRAGMIKRLAGEGRCPRHASKIRIAPIDDGVAADEQKTIDLSFHSRPMTNA
jgi:hypothetical protein